MTTDQSVLKRLEAAVQRLPLLPERRAEVDRAVTGLTFVIRSVSGEKDPSTAQSEAQQAERAKEREAECYAAAVEIRDVEWALLDIKEAWDRMSDKAHKTILAHINRAGQKDSALLRLIEGHEHIVETIALAADELEHPDRPIRVAPTAAADDPALMLAKHAARVFTRLTGKTPPRPRAGEHITPGAFFWLLEDIFRAANVTASVESYIRKVAES
jgi:hypothetical protein